MRFNRKTPFLLLGLLALLAMAGCKGKDGADTNAPAEYLVGEEKISALIPEEGATVAEQEGPAIYIYGGLSTPGDTVKEYTAQLTTEEAGFTVVDETFRKTETPDFAVAEGTVLLAKDAAEEGKVLSVLLDWDGDTCTVTVDAQDGKVDLTEPQSMTLTEAEDYFKGLSPIVLGLDGQSMQEYRVYSLNGAILVDSTPCLQLSVYSNKNPEGTNELIGRYLMSGDGRSIYLVDENGGVEKLV